MSSKQEHIPASAPASQATEENRNETISKAAGAYRRVARSALLGSSVEELINRASEALDCIVFVESDGSSSHVSAGPANALESTPLHEDPAPQAGSRNEKEAAFSSRLIFDAKIRGAGSGSVSFIRSSQPFTEPEKAAAEGIADIILLTMANRQRSSRIEAYAIKGLVRSLIEGSVSDPEAVTETVSSIGFDINRPYRMMSIETNESTAEEAAKDDQRRNRFLRLLDRSAGECLARIGEGLTLKKDNRVIMLLHDPSSNSDERIARDNAAKLLAHIETEFPGAAFTICIGPVCQKIEDYKHSYETVARIAEFCHSFGKKDRIVSLKQFGAKALFYSALRPKSLLQYSADRIKPLIEYDRKQSGNLISTLRVFLDSGANVSQSAQKLYISYGGMRYRLREIESLTGLSLKDSGTLYELFLALDILEMAGEDAILTR